MGKQLHLDDVVAKVGDESELGVVEKTHEDIDTHEPRPERSDPEGIGCGENISSVAFRKFLKDGVPPKGTILVRWVSVPSAQLVQEASVKLVDRSLLIGDVVKKTARDAMSGVIINTFTRCTLQPMCEVRYRHRDRLRGLIPLTPPEAPISQEAEDKPPVLRDIPARELTYAESPTEEDLVIYKDWIGRVDGTACRIALKLVNDSVVEISDEDAHHADGSVVAFNVGDIAVTKKGILRSGQWIFGQYNPNIAPVGTVVQSRLVEVGITWLHQRIGSRSSDEPPQTLERDEFESDDFCAYDRTRRPPETPASEHTAFISNSEIDVRLGLRVRFKDLLGACVKYDGSTPCGKLPRIERKDTLGFDINVFDVVSLETDVVVQWQDLSVTKEKSIDLVPDLAIDDEHAAWPGEVAHILEFEPAPGITDVEQPKRVGVIQCVDAVGRMAKIRWAPEACVHYSSTGEDGYRSLLTSAVGQATGEIQELSLYDLEAPAPMNVRRGDIVLVSNREVMSPDPRAREWLGEIVDTRLDGSLIIRLGAALHVRDIKVRREDCVVAVRSDGTVDADFDWMNESNGMLDGDDLDAVDDEDDEMDNDDYDARDDEELQAEYEDENGELLDPEDVENEDWESDDGNEDEIMTDAPQETPPTSHSATPPGNRQADASNPADGTERKKSWPEPPRYLILDGPIPTSHRFATQPATGQAAHAKRTQKEHKILRSPDSLPSGVFVRSWESRLDLLRVLFVGPSDTPYQDAPFVFDIYLPPEFPTEPPQTFFHSWPSESGLGGAGRVNPNLYEDGKVCLSLLGTWEGNKGEGWNTRRSTLLQILVSILGLVLVKEPYFNEAGYEPMRGVESSKRPSALYSERTFLRARTFIITALGSLVEGKCCKGLEGVEDVVKALYLDNGGPRLLGHAIEVLEGVLERSKATGVEPDGLNTMSVGACIPLRRVLERLHQLQATSVA